MFLQRTIRKRAAVNGIGLHTGAPAKLTFCPAPEGTGVWFVRRDLPGAPALKALAESVTATSLATVLGGEAFSVSTVEHCLSALAALRIDNLFIELEGPEIPIGDGSAKPFLDAILEAGVVEQDQPRKYAYISQSIYYGTEDKHAYVLPYNGLRVTCTIEFPHKAIGKQTLDLDINEHTFTTTNPLLQVSDIPKLKKIAQKNDVHLMVDNTFTPMIISPAKLGADIVVYSMTKFINGKNDCVGGAICGSEEFIESLSNVNDGTAMLLGPVLDPLRSSSILKNLHTLHLRMKQHSHNALFLAQKLSADGVRVIYPGLTTHTDHELVNYIMNSEFGYGGIIAIDLNTPEEASDKMKQLQELGVGYLAVSLGYFKTLFSNSGSSTSSEIPEEIQKEMGLTPGLVRFSIGLDNDIERTYENFKKVLV